MSEWQPIETAPKDGTFVVVFAEKNPNGRKVRRASPVCVAAKRGWMGWVATPGDYQVSPTHWLPLPAPPQTPMEGERG